MQLVKRDELMIRMRDANGSGAEEQRLAPGAEEGHVGGEGKHARFEAGDDVHPDGRHVENRLRGNPRLLYRDKPLSRIGMIQSFLFRSARLVVDTGMHAKGWSREQAITYFMDTVGRNRGATEREIDRYVARPGQACAYKIGHNEMLRIREATRRRLGSRFDIKAYHDLVLLSGDMPLEVLASLAGEWDGA